MICSRVKYSSYATVYSLRFRKFMITENPLEEWGTHKRGSWLPSRDETRGVSE